jgi:hypothetical protein
MLCKGRHLTHLYPHMEEASTFLEDMIVSQPQLPAAYRTLSLNPPIVDGMINLVPHRSVWLIKWSIWSHPWLNQLSKWSI